jgi:hypothetical protein
VYSDPTGMVTITQTTVQNVINNILSTIQNNLKTKPSKKLIGEAQSAATDIFTNALQSLGPSSTINLPIDPSNQGRLLETVMEGIVCAVLGNTVSAYTKFLDYIHYEPGIKKDGTPVENGRFRCDSNGGVVGPLTGMPNTRHYPDFVIKRGSLVGTDERKPPAFLIGDFKRDVTTIKPKEDQFKAIMSYAQAVWQFPSPGYQYAPVALYVTLVGGKKKQAEKNRQGEALKYGVFLKIISLRD